MIEIEIEGLPELLNIVDAILAFTDADTIGRVYSTGAIGPDGHRYEEFVQDSRKQAAMHQGIWQTDEDVSRENAIRMVGTLEEGLQILIDSAGRASEALRARIRQALEMLQTALKVQPARSSTYVRTGRLMNSWAVEVGL